MVGLCVTVRRRLGKSLMVRSIGAVFTTGGAVFMVRFYRVGWRRVHNRRRVHNLARRRAQHSSTHAAWRLGRTTRWSGCERTVGARAVLAWPLRARCMAVALWPPRTSKLVRMATITPRPRRSCLCHLSTVAVSRGPLPSRASPSLLLFASTAVSTTHPTVAVSTTLAATALARCGCPHRAAEAHAHGWRGRSHS